MVNGFLLINKPGGISSFDVIRKIKTIFPNTKIGHTGTLDVNAEGLLILTFGKACRLIKYMCLEPKVYEFSICFGKQTDTLDDEGKIIFTSDIIPSFAEVSNICSTFLGEQMQIPPSYSALKINGKRAYSLARKGINPPLQERKIFIAQLSLLNYNIEEKIATYRVSCSTGTYIRALARDIASKLGTVGYATSIKRISAGNFSVEDAIFPHSVTTSTPLLSLPQGLPHIPVVDIDETTFNKISNGIDVFLTLEVEKAFVRYKNEIVGLIEKKKGGKYHPSIVFKNES